MGGKHNLEAQTQADTETKIGEMNQRVNQMKAEVIDNLVLAVQNVIPQLPRNFVLNQGS